MLHLDLSIFFLRLQRLIQHLSLIARYYILKLDYLYVFLIHSNTR